MTIFYLPSTFFQLLLALVDVTLLKIRLDTVNAELWKSVIDSSAPGVPIKSQQVNGQCYMYARTYNCKLP